MRQPLTMAALAVALCGCRFDPQGLSTSDRAASGTDQRLREHDQRLLRRLRNRPDRGYALLPLVSKGASVPTSCWPSRCGCPAQAWSVAEVLRSLARLRQDRER